MIFMKFDLVHQKVSATGLVNTGNVQGLGANLIGACIMDGPKSIRNFRSLIEGFQT